MDQTIGSLVRLLRPYFDGGLEKKGEGVLSLKDDELGMEASCCTTAEVAAFYVLDYELHGGDGLETAAALARDVLLRQLDSGAYGQPYYVKHGDAGTVDIAEIGAAANALYWVYRKAGSQEAGEALLKSARYLLTQVAVENRGAVYKNPNARNHDVLNGNMYAAHTLARAFEISGDNVFRGKVEDIFKHLLRRFGVHSPDWWPYTEQWDGSLGMGNSVSYQAIVIAFASTAARVLPPQLAKEWGLAAQKAARVMLTSMEEGAYEGNEAPWWCRDWSSVWEIDYALSLYPEWPEASSYVRGRLGALEISLRSEGPKVFRPKGLVPDPERTPVSTTFRKAATFAGILSYMVLDLKDYEAGRNTNEAN